MSKNITCFLPASNLSCIILSEWIPNLLLYPASLIYEAKHFTKNTKPSTFFQPVPLLASSLKMLQSSRVLPCLIYVLYISRIVPFEALKLSLTMTYTYNISTQKHPLHHYSLSTCKSHYIYNCIFYEGPQKSG